MSYAKLSSKAQIVIPAEMRRKLRVNPGDNLEISLQGEVITIRKAPLSHVEALADCASGLWQGYEDELQKARDQWDS